jgi:acyl-CoA thioester hydrolase
MTALPREGVVSDGVFFYPVRVYYEDTDAGGVVYYVNYLKFAERARSEMLRHLGIGQERLRAEGGLLFVVRRSSAEYLLPARLDDDLTVATRLTGLGAATLDLDQEVRRDGALLVRLAFQIAAVGAHGRPQRLPPALRAALTPLNETTKMVTAHAR